MLSRRSLLFALTAILVLSVPLTAGAAADPWLDEDFENGVDGLMTSIIRPLETTSNGHVGAGARATIPSGANWGASGRWNFEDHGLAQPEEMYWRYYLQFPTGFYIEPPYRGKLPGPANLHTYNCLGLRVSTEAEPCWSARMLFSRDYKTDTGLYQDGPSDETLIGFYTYHLDGPSDRGEIITWDDDVALLDHGQWYCVEGRIDLNTPGMNDGILEGWVDGELAYSRSDFKWRRASESFLDVEMFWLDFYYGKEGEGSTKSMEIRFDSLALGPERIGCDDALVWNGAFMDDDGSVFESDIEWLAASGITKSCNPPDDNRFCPDDVVTRGQMAAFLGRALDLTEGVGEDYFTDDNASVFENDIDRFAHAGITKGCTATTFCPGSGITREQMAAFLTRAYDLPATDEDFFTDDEGSIFEDAINRLAASGITTGCSATTFCGSDSVTRAQMAAFLKRAES